MSIGLKVSLHFQCVAGRTLKSHMSLALVKSKTQWLLGIHCVDQLTRVHCVVTMDTTE